jgi:hypothetical protein
VIDERARHELYRAVEELLGTRIADTLMALLPPVGWADVATKDDLLQLEARLDTRLDARFARAEGRTDARFGAVDARVRALDVRFEAIDARFSRMDARFAQLEGQLDRSLREQTRTLMLGLVGAMFTMTSLYLGAVTLAA